MLMIRMLARDDDGKSMTKVDPRVRGRANALRSFWRATSVGTVRSGSA